MNLKERDFFLKKRLYVVLFGLKKMNKIFTFDRLEKIDFFFFFEKKSVIR